MSVSESEHDMLHRLTDELRCRHTLDRGSLRTLVAGCLADETVREALHAAARETTRSRFGTGVYLRGLIEISNYCRNDCRYCGLRRSNRRAERYRLDLEAIVTACQTGYEAGLRTFVLQGGEDPAWNDERLCATVSEIHRRWPECAITLSLGERSEESYRRLRWAGATRYLLRHEAADATLYAALHPSDMSLARRLECLDALKRTGYQVGTGFMVGVPGQTLDHVVTELEYIARLKPQMIGIGPFVPQRDTPLGNRPAGNVELTLVLLSVLRLMHPAALIPSTTALATLAPQGRVRGVLAGANVVMPNLSPAEVRAKYAIYDGKAATGCEAVEGLAALGRELAAAGATLSFERGDYKDL